MPTLAERPNSKKKPNNMEGKELVNWEESHYAQIVGIMDHTPKKY